MTVPGRVSAVVTTRNSVAHLEPLLASVTGQTYPDVELLVVDNSSSDGTAALAERYADRVLVAGPERSAQRNRGVEAASGEYVLILDSDMVLEPGVMAACVEAASGGEVAAVVIPEMSVGEGFWAACKALERSCYVGDDTIEAARFFKRDAFLLHGGYDEELTGPEDWDLPARMRRDAATIGRAEGVAIVHDEGRLRLSELLRKKFYYGKTLDRYMRRHTSLALRQSSFIRPAFVRHRHRLFRRPLHASGMLLMKAAELSAGAAGLIAARLVRES